jgi:hypothetical protein
VAGSRCIPAPSPASTLAWCHAGSLHSCPQNHGWWRGAIWLRLHAGAPAVGDAEDGAGGIFHFASALMTRRDRAMFIHNYRARAAAVINSSRGEVA